MPAPKLRARIQFDASSSDRVRREWWLGIVEEHTTKGGRAFTLATVDWDRLAGWLLSFGTTATVLGPNELRRLLITRCKEAAAHHQKTSQKVPPDKLS